MGNHPLARASPPFDLLCGSRKWHRVALIDRSHDLLDHVAVLSSFTYLPRATGFDHLPIVGSVLLVAGLYNVLWGKSREDKQAADRRDGGGDGDVERNAAAVQPADGETEEDDDGDSDATRRRPWGSSMHASIDDLRINPGDLSWPAWRAYGRCLCDHCTKDMKIDDYQALTLLDEDFNKTPSKYNTSQIDPSIVPRCTELTPADRSKTTMAEEAKTTKKKGWASTLSRRKAHCTACCVTLCVLIILGALAIAFYIRYRPRPPRVVATPVDVSIDEFSLLPHPTLKVSVGVHVVVSNPSQSPYRYGAALAPVTYHGAPVGETLVPAGEIDGKSTKKVEPATVVDGLKVAENPHFASDAVAGVLPFARRWCSEPFEVPVTVEVVCFVQMYVFHGESSSRRRAEAPAEVTLSRESMPTGMSSRRVVLHGLMIVVGFCVCRYSVRRFQTHLPLAARPPAVVLRAMNWWRTRQASTSSFSADEILSTRLISLRPRRSHGHRYKSMAYEGGKVVAGPTDIYCTAGRPTNRSCCMALGLAPAGVP
nr:unnamed protein product [Digitaria exilis]